MSRRLLPGPGLARCGVRRPFARRALQLVRSDDPLWSRWLQQIDVISEGLATQEGDAWIYRGSTSVILLSDRHGGSLPHEAIEQALQVASRDPHLWVRILRIARREAVSRSPGPLDSMHSQLRLALHPSGIRFDLDVEARVLCSTGLVKTKR